MVFKKLAIRIIDTFGLRFNVQRFQFNVQRNRIDSRRRWIRYENNGEPASSLSSALDLLIIAPWADTHRQPWEIAGGNYFFEILQSAREFFGERQIKCLKITFGQMDWARQIVNQVISLNPRNILLQVETDPDGSGDWNIDSLARSLKSLGWTGQLFLLSYDSVFPLHMFRIDRVTRIYRKSVVISIDRSCRDYYRAKAPNIGPAFLPISEVSLTAINQHFLSDTVREKLGLESKLTFIGAEYGYRSIALKSLLEVGVEVSINPHIKGFDTPSYLEYATALHSSLATLNFSRANVIEIAQVKSRVIEAMLFNCIVVTDDGQVLEKFFEPSLDFIYYSSPQELLRIYENLLLDKERQNQIKQSALKRAREVNKSSFWGEIEKLMD